MKTKFFILLFNLLLLLFLGEVASRLFPTLFDKPPPFNTAILDDTLGWCQKPNYKFKGTQYTLGKKPYKVKLNFQENGFRCFPKASEGPDTTMKVLVIGDSFTQAVEVSDGQQFYSYLDSNFQVFAYGMAGYGTLQEKLILEKYFNQIQPDYVILQFCSNDFIDNNYNLEQGASYRVGLRRPYLAADGKITYKSPLPYFEQQINRSKFLKFVYEKFLRIKLKLGFKNTQSSEFHIASNGQAYAPFKNSIKTTKSLLSEIKSLIYPSAQLIVMAADSFQPQDQTIQQICESIDISFIPFPGLKMESAQIDQEIFTADGFHWTPYGHRIIGQNLLEHISVKFNLKHSK